MCRISALNPGTSLSQPGPWRTQPTISFGKNNARFRWRYFRVSFGYFPSDHQPFFLGLDGAGLADTDSLAVAPAAETTSAISAAGAKDGTTDGSCSTCGFSALAARFDLLADDRDRVARFGFSAVSTATESPEVSGSTVSDFFELARVDFGPVTGSPCAVSPLAAGVAAVFKSGLSATLAAVFDFEVRDRVTFLTGASDLTGASVLAAASATGAAASSAWVSGAASCAALASDSAVSLASSPLVEARVCVVWASLP